MGQSKQRANGGSKARELGKHGGQGWVGLQAVVGKGGWANGAETGRSTD
jgi:hypothetical protein